MRTFLQGIPAAWGPKHCAATGALAHTRTGPDQIALTPPVTFALVLLTPQPEREVALGTDRRTIGLAPTGGVEIVPAGADLFARWRSEKENMLFALETEQLADLAEGEFGDGEVSFRPPASASSIPRRSASPGWPATRSRGARRRTRSASTA